MCKAQKYVSHDVLSLSILGCIYVPQHEFDLLKFNYACTMGKIILLAANVQWKTTMACASGIANMNTCEISNILSKKSMKLSWIQSISLKYILNIFIMANGSKIQIGFKSLKTFVKVTNLDYCALNVFVWIVKKR